MELEGHEGGKGFDFLLVNIFGVPGAALGGELMGLVLASVGRYHFDGAVI